MYSRRAIEETILKVSNMFPILLVTGPRQVGKTTLLQKLSERAADVRRKADGAIRDPIGRVGKFQIDADVSRIFVAVGIPQSESGGRRWW